MNTRPNLPVGLVVIAVLSYALSGWGAEGPPAKDAGATPTQAAPQPTQKPAAPAQAPAKPAVPAPPPAAPATPLPSDPLAVLRLARERLTGARDKQSPNEVQSIRARIVERVCISGRRFRLEGLYLQGVDLRLRLDLKVISDNPQNRVDGSLREICNGTILWAVYQVGKETRITRRDVSLILNASKTNGQINFSTVELGLGGLPALLASLDRWMKFDSIKQEEINGKKFTVLGGAWKDSCLKELLMKMSKQHLPEHVPDQVRIYLEPELLFPRRIAFLKHRGTQFEPLVELDLLDIVINGPIDEHQFEYAPPDGARPVDVTTEYVQQLQNSGL